MFKLNEQVFDVPWHTDATASICIVPFDSDTRKFIEEYKLAGRDRDGWVYFEIRRGCYGLPQAGILANDLLQSCLLTEGYYEAESTPGLWRHK